MNNEQFLKVLEKSFSVYLQTNSRSNQKLKALHGAISEDLLHRLDEGYSVSSLGYGDGKEKSITGRYMSKVVDIAVFDGLLPIAGIAVKYVMSNYSQNSNNYFENMLGETANIRAVRIPYYQILVIPDCLPYFDKNGKIKKWDHISANNLSKYAALSKDNVDIFPHTPNKTLLYLIHLLPEGDKQGIVTAKEYRSFYLENPFSMQAQTQTTVSDGTVICNDYERFAQKVAFSVKGL